MREWKNLPYAAENAEKQAYDLYAPDEGQSLRGAAIWFHGGGLTAGQREDNAFLAAPLAARGIALALCSYRLMPEARFPAFIQDAARAAAAVLARLRKLGSCPVILGGSSAGAYLSMMLAFDRRFLAAEGLAPEDFDGFLFDAGQPTAHYNVLSARGEDPRLVLIDETAPLYHVRDARPGKPLSILCAENDMPSRRTQNLLLVETLRRFGYPEALITMETFPGCRHCEYDGRRDADGNYIMENRISALIERCARG